jgi:type IX secretion system PorP/SprF family membrane protein
MKKVNKILGFLLLLLWANIGLAQQQVMFTQYMFNGLAINPAYAGSHETVSASVLMREQWVGIEGAPSTQTFSIHSPIFSKKMAAGVVFLHDKIGVTQQNGMYASLAYRVYFKENSSIAFGLQGGFTGYNALFSKVSITDPTFSSGDVSELKPNAGAGIYYNTPKFYAGISVPQLIESEFDKNNPDSDSKMIRHYFIHAGYVMDVLPHLKLKPNILIKSVSGAPIQFDLNLNALIHEFLWLGASWRSFESVDVLCQLQLTEKLQMGYSYDMATTSEIRRVNSGSHELMLNYRFTFKRNKVITPRYF